VTMLTAMLINRRHAAQFAARVVRSMIRLGCDAATMRHYRIPTSVFYGVLGGCYHLGTRSPDDLALENMRWYREDYLYNKQLH
jgi:hypothetical protein